MAKRSGIMLCYPFEERRLTNPKFNWVFPVLVQPKLDGERCRAIPQLMSDFDTHKLLSSECNEINLLPHINEKLNEIIPSDRLELDGELYNHGMDFSEIHSIVSRRKEIHPSHTLIEYHIFDAVFPTLQQEGRLSYLHMLQKKYFSDPLSPIKIVPSVWAGSVEEVFNIYNIFVSAGYEGIIVRHPHLQYVRKRSNWILKFKPKKEDRYRIIGFEEALTIDTKSPKGMVGKVICESFDSEDVFPVGAGCLTHQERKHMWNNQDDYIGRDLLVQYQSRLPSGAVRFGLAVEVI